MADKSNFRATLFLEEQFGFLPNEEDYDEEDDNLTHDSNKESGNTVNGGPMSTEIAVSGDTDLENGHICCDSDSDTRTSKSTSFASSRQSDVSQNSSQTENNAVSNDAPSDETETTATANQSESSGEDPPTNSVATTNVPNDDQETEDQESSTVLDNQLDKSGSVGENSTVQSPTSPRFFFGMDKSSDNPATQNKYQADSRNKNENDSNNAEETDSNQADTRCKEENISNEDGQILDKHGSVGKNSTVQTDSSHNVNIDAQSVNLSPTSPHFYFGMNKTSDNPATQNPNQADSRSKEENDSNNAEETDSNQADTGSKEENNSNEDGERCANILRRNVKDSTASVDQSGACAEKQEVKTRGSELRGSVLPGGGRVSVFISNEFEFLEDEDESDEESEVVKDAAQQRESSTSKIESHKSGTNVCENERGENESKTSIESKRNKTNSEIESEWVEGFITAIDRDINSNQNHVHESNSPEDKSVSSVRSSHTKPRSPLLDRVKNSEISPRTSKRSSSGSFNVASMSSMDSDTDSDLADISTENSVFDAENDDNTSQGCTSPGRGMQRSVSVSTTASEREYQSERTVRVERPYIRQKKNSVTSYKRLTQKLPDIQKQVPLERTDVTQSFGFHILKAENPGAFNPIYISTVEPESLAQQAGIEVGSTVITVNGESVLSYTEAEVVEVIKKDSLRVVLGLGFPLNPVPLKSGYLLKMSSGLMRTYKKRWFELKPDNCLYYYKQREDTQPSGAICLSNYTVVKSPEFDPMTFKLVKYEQKTYQLRAGSVEEMICWGDVIRRAAEARTRMYPELTSHHIHLPAMQIKAPDCYGFLYKRSSGGARIYQRRYAVLKDASLYYYADPSSATAKGVAHLHGYTCVSEFTHARKYGFTMSPPEIKMKTFSFLTETEAERRKWMTVMTSSIEKWKVADDVTDVT